jgi:hypothetical protein
MKRGATDSRCLPRVPVLFCRVGGLAAAALPAWGVPVAAMQGRGRPGGDHCGQPKCYCI